MIVTPEIVRPIPEGRLPGLELPSRLPGRSASMSATGPVPANPPTQSIPVEQLDSIEEQNQMKLEKKCTVGTPNGESRWPSPPYSGGGAPTGPVRKQ